MKIGRKGLIQFIVAALVGGIGVVATLLLLSQGASARPMQQASLSISKIESADPVQVGGQLVYTLTYQNPSTETVTGVVITDTLDPNVAYVSASPAPSGGEPDAPFWSIGTLSDSVSGQIVLTVTVASPLPNGTLLTNTATIDGNEVDPTSTQIATTVAAPTLELSKEDDPDPVMAGASLTYTLAYTNSGDSTATDVVITDVLDNNVTFVSASPPPSGGTGNTRTWDIGSLSPSASGQILISVTVQTGLAEGTTLTNTATIDSQQTDPLSAGQTTGVIAHDDPVSVSLAPATATVTAGTSISYTLTAYDAYGNDWDVTDSGTYTITPGAGGTWAANVYTAEVAGTWTVTGTYGGENDTATLTVEAGPLDHILICTDTGGQDPATDHAMTTDETWALWAAGYDAQGNFIANQVVTWSVSGGIGVVTPTTGVSATLDATTPGTGQVHADHETATDDDTGTITVSVGDLDHIVICTDENGQDPATDHEMTTDDQWALWAAGYDADDNFIANQDVRWESTGTLDPVSAQGTGYTFDPFTADTNGTIIVEDLEGHTDATGIITVTVGAPNRVELAPDSATRMAGESISYTLTAYDADDNNWDVTADGVYTITPGTGGTWAANVYTTEVAGTWTVTGTYSGLSDTGALTVTHAGAASLSLSPSTATLTAGESITYTVMAADAYGNGWDATDEAGYEIEAGAGGSWTANVYTSQFASTWTVTATVDAVSDTGTLTVTHASLDHVGLTPATATILAGQSITYTLTAYDVYDNGWDVSDSGAYTVTPGAGGSWAANVYTAEVAGTWTVTGTYDGQLDTGALTVQPAELDHIVVSPASAVIQAGDVQTYTAEAFDRFDNSRGDVTDDTTFGIVEPGHGGIWTDNVYTSQNPGDWTVRGVYSDTTDDAALTVLAPVLHLEKSARPAPIEAGAYLTYTLIYSNTGNQTATGTVVTDTLDPNLDYIDASPPPTGFSNGDPYWTLASLEPDESDQIVLRVQVHTPLPNNTVLTNTAAINCDQTDPASITITTTVHSAPVLSLVKTDGPDPVEAGDQLVYTLTYTNTGNEIATGTVITDLLDPYVTFVDADPPAQGTGQTRTWAIGDLPPGGPQQILITVTVDSPLPNGTVLTNTAWLDTDQTAPLSITEETTVHSRPVLEITKSDDPDPVSAGEYLYYTIVITNSGNENAASVVVVEEYDPNISFVYASPDPDPGTDDQWTIGTLNAGDSRTVEVVVDVASPLPVGTVLTNTATVDCAQTTPVSTTETTDVLSETDLRVSQVDDPDPVEAGAELIYMINYENTGTAPATGVVITDTYDSRVTFISANPPPDVGNNVWLIGDLAAGESGSILVRVNVHSPLPNGSVLVNTVTIDSNESPPANFITTTQVTSAPDLAFTAADRPDPVEAGAELTYTLRYTNTGNADATDVVVTATLDSHVFFNSATPEPTGGSGGTWYWEIGSIPGEGGVGEIVIHTDVELPLPNGTLLDFAAQLTDAEGDFLEDTEQTTVHSAPVISFSKSDGVPTAYAGDMLLYTLAYTNSGNENAYNLIITDTLPDYVQYVNCDISGGNCEPISEDEMVFRIHALEAQTSGEGRLLVQVIDPLPAGARFVINQARMGGPALPVPLEAEDVDAIGTRPDLTVATMHHPLIFSPGGLMTYTLTYGNAGRMDAEGVVITTSLPVSTTYVGYGWSSSDGQTYTYTAGDLPAGDTGHTITFTVVHTESAQIGAPEYATPFVIGETANGGGDANPDDNTAVEYVGVPDLVVASLDVEPRPVVANVQITFTIVVENRGTGQACDPENNGCGGGFWVDIFIAPVPSYPADIYGIDYAGAAPIPPGGQSTVVITHTFTEQELQEVEDFYAKVDNYDRYEPSDERPEYGLVPESNEWNNVSVPVDPWASTYYIYLPLILK